MNLTKLTTQALLEAGCYKDVSFNLKLPEKLTTQYHQLSLF